MTKRFDVCSPRPRKDSDKPFWHRVGTAWEGEKGINITFDSLPLPDKDGRVSVALFEAKEKSERQTASNQASAQTRRGSMKDSLDDEVPF
jgi:hypothetical protein